MHIFPFVNSNHFFFIVIVCALFSHLMRVDWRVIKWLYYKVNVFEVTRGITITQQVWKPLWSSKDAGGLIKLCQTFRIQTVTIVANHPIQVLKLSVKDVKNWEEVGLWVKPSVQSVWDILFLENAEDFMCNLWCSHMRLTLYMAWVQLDSCAINSPFIPTSEGHQWTYYSISIVYI